MGQKKSQPIKVEPILEDSQINEFYHVEEQEQVWIPGTCPICTMDIDLEDDHVFLNCNCQLHTDCLFQLLRTCVDSQGEVEFKCAYLGCGSKIQLEELSVLEELGIDDELFQGYLDYKLKEYLQIQSSVKKCTECEIFFEWEPNEGGCDFVECFNCGKTSCGYCNEEPHNSECVIGYNSDFKRCKMCNNYIERSSGCPYVTCRCGYQFCFICDAPKLQRCGCSPGHGYYAVGKVLSNWGSSSHFICYCGKEICECK